MPIRQPERLSLTEAAIVLGLPYKSLHDAMTTRRLPVVRQKVGLSVRLFVRRSDLPAFAEVFGVEAPTDAAIAVALELVA